MYAPRPGTLGISADIQPDQTYDYGTSQGGYAQGAYSGPTGGVYIPPPVPSSSTTPTTSSPSSSPSSPPSSPTPTTTEGGGGQVITPAFDLTKPTLPVYQYGGGASSPPITPSSASATAASSAPAPSQAGLGWIAGLAVLGAFLAMAARRRRSS